MHEFLKVIGLAILLHIPIPIIFEFGDLGGHGGPNLLMLLLAGLIIANPVFLVQLVNKKRYLLFAFPIVILSIIIVYGGYIGNLLIIIYAVGIGFGALVRFITFKEQLFAERIHRGFKVYLFSFVFGCLAIMAAFSLR